MLVAFCGVVGLIFGSFANVVIHRVPRGESLSTPPSTCPNCGNRISPRDNIPVVSWLLLRGRCRSCGEPISARYPIVEAVMGAAFALVAARIGLEWSLPGFLLFTWVLVVVAIIDTQTRKIPNRLMYPLTPALLALMVAAALLAGEPRRALAVVLGGVGAFVFLLILALINPRGMGMGDVKLAAFIGIALGYLNYAHVILGLFAGFLVGAVGGLALVGVRVVAARRAAREVQGGPLRKQMIPFGPYLAVGALLALLVGEPLIEAYLRSLGVR